MLVHWATYGEIEIVNIMCIITDSSYVTFSLSLYCSTPSRFRSHSLSYMTLFWTVALCVALWWKMRMCMQEWRNGFLTIPKIILTRISHVLHAHYGLLLVCTAFGMRIAMFSRIQLSMCRQATNTSNMYTIMHDVCVCGMTSCHLTKTEQK